MAVVKLEDVVAYRVGDERDPQVICPDCIGERSFEGMAQDDFITQDEIERINESGEEVIFCDVCKKMIR